MPDLIPGPDMDEVLAEASRRVAERMSRGVVTAEEIDRVSRHSLRIFDGDDSASEAFRLCCVAWEVDRTPPISSHRPVIGPFIVALKRGVAWVLRFQNETFLARQREFNRNLLLVLREILDRTPKP